MKLVVEPMELEDIPQVLEVDRESYSLPWPASAYRREVLHNRNAHYLVLRTVPDHYVDGERDSAEPRGKLPFPFLRWSRSSDRPGRPGRILGYAGMWLMVDEAHITTIAIRHAWRGRGLGELLLVSLIDLAVGRDIERVTLEVRVSNETAQNLYQKYGFRHEGVRHRYYSDNNEDAYIMTTGVIQEEAYQRELDARLAALIRRLQSDSEYEIHAPAFIRLAGAQSAHGAD